MRDGDVVKRMPDDEMGTYQPEDLLGSTDAMEWARAFVDTCRRERSTADPLDEGFMVAWFANAMQAMETKITGGMNMPIPMTREEVQAILDDIAKGFETGDTLEGSIEFLCGGGPGDEDHPGWDCRASYRIGNAAGGQGGIRLIGTATQGWPGDEDEG